MMRRAPAGRFSGNRRGSTAVEFAIVAPIIVIGAAIGMAVTIAAWSSAALETTAQETARCAARSTACGTTVASCASSDQAVCFAIDLAGRRGFSPLPASGVTVSRSHVVNGVTFVKVDIAATKTIAGYSFTQTASAIYPK